MRYSRWNALMNVVADERERHSPMLSSLPAPAVNVKQNEPVQPGEKY